MEGGNSWRSILYALRYININIVRYYQFQISPYFPTNNLKYYYLKRQFYLPSKSALRGVVNCIGYPIA